MKLLQIRIRIEPKIFNKAKEIAEKENLSFSQFVEKILKQYLKELK